MRLYRQALSVGAGEIGENDRCGLEALVYRGEYDRAGQVSRDALAAAGSTGDPVALVGALRARQLACCAPDGVAERAALASRMLAR